jgi:hypothetical protein
VKFNECVIIKGEAMHKNKVLMSGWNMVDIGEGEGASGVGIMEVPIRVMSIHDPLAA